MPRRTFTLLASLAALLIAPAAAQAGGLTATFATSSDWGSGFVGGYTISNGTGSTVNGWKLEFDLPLNETLTGVWNGNLSQVGGHYVITNASWNQAIAPGTSVNPGFQGAYSGTFTAPQNCLINGQPCAGGAPPPPPPPPPDTTPPSAPGGLTAGTATTTSVPLSWTVSTDNVGVTGYRVYNGSTQVASVTGISTTVTGLSPSTTYTFTVKAIDAAGNLSAASNPVTVTTATPPPGGVTAAFAKSSDWGSGFVGGYTITNSTSSTVNGWRLEFDLPAGASIVNAWSGNLSSSGNHYVLTDVSWNHTLAPGGTAQVGFQVAYSTGFSAPSNCLINGQPCAGGAPPPPPPPPPDTTPPSAPGGLTAGTATTTSVPLSWTASTDNVGVTGYRVYNGSTQVASVTGTSTTVTGLSPSTTYTFTVKAIDAAGNLSAASNPVTVTTPAPASGGGSGATPAEFAPYVDMTLYPQFSLGQAARTAQIKHFTLAFIVSGGGCKGAWGGVTALDDPWITSSLADLKAAGGDAIVSFGGEAGQELAAACTSVDALTAQYQAVINQYGIRDLDFDVEGAAVADATSIDRRSKALAALQAAGKAAGQPVHVSFTLPVMPTGLTQDGLNVIRSAIANGVDVGQVNVMAMDYFDPSLSYSGHMGDLAIQAAQSTHDQLATLYTGKSDAQLWAMVGVTPMIGINDDNQEIFTTADAAKLVAFANGKSLGRLAFWSANRDAPCPSPTQWTSNTCSGVSDPQWAFSQAFEAFPSSPPPSSSGPSLKVSGKQLVDGSGAPLRVAGVNRSGSEYACAQGWGLFDGPVDDASISSMTAWGINAVRVPLNEDCWLGINGVNSAYAGANYQSAIRGYVNRLLAHNLAVILDLHWGAPGTQLAQGQEQAPDADHAPAFWSSVAAAYKGVSGVAFDLFNEPHDISWSCWLNGCAMSGGWQAAGEQQLINAVRGAGATQPVIVEGNNWGGDLSGWLANPPHDPAGQLAAGWHIYNFSGCNTTSCWDTTVAPVAQQVPVLATEIGENDCAGGFLNTLLPWADSHQIGYLAWAWNAANCQSGPSLISDYAGTPTGYGAAYKSYLAAHPVTAMVTRAAVRVSAARKKIRRPRSCPAKHGRRRGHHRPVAACRPSSTRKRGHRGR